MKAGDLKCAYSNRSQRANKAWDAMAQICLSRQRSRRRSRLSLLVACHGHPVGNEHPGGRFGAPGQWYSPLGQTVAALAVILSEARPMLGLCRQDPRWGYACRPSISGRKDWLSQRRTPGCRPTVGFAPTQGLSRRCRRIPA